AVVTEQIATEQALGKVCKSLQQQLEEKQTETSLLLTKVELLEKQELIRLKLNEGFVKGLGGRSEVLMTTIQQSLTINEEQSSQLTKSLESLE
ncbi:hypothetical protein ABTL43_19230, partial [Acinetobacter baumannii]